MRIGINAFHLHEHSGGVTNYVETLLREWSRYYPGDRLILYVFDHNRSMIDSLDLDSGIDVRFLATQEEIADQWGEMDLFFCPFGAYWPRPAPIPAVVALMDIQERFFPEYFSKEDLASRFYHYDWSLWMADRVIAISDFTKESFVKILGTPRRKIDRIYLCADELPEDCVKPTGFPESGFADFIYYPANNWPHKNHIRLLDALQQLKAAGNDIPCLFSGVIGQGGVDIEKEIEQRGLRGSCRHLGRVSRREVSWLFRNASLLAYPSLFEGFGIPVVEAHLLGLPVLRSNYSSLAEVGMAGDLICDPYDTGDIAKQLLRGRSCPRSKSLGARFAPRQLVEQHRQTFEKAIRGRSSILNRYRAWVMKRKAKLERCELTPREAEAARKLLREPHE